MASPVQLPDSADACDIPSTPYEVALAEILSQVEPVSETERLPIRDALHRVAAEVVTAKYDVPGSRNSAMDGYACRFNDLSPNGKVSRLKAGWHVSCRQSISRGNPFRRLHSDFDRRRRSGPVGHRHHAGRL